MAIAAGRVGLDCVTIGHVGDDIYGRFLLDVLHDEGISMVGMMTPTQQHSDHVATSYQTLLCWVLVDPLQRHGFCRYTPLPTIIISISYLCILQYLKNQSTLFLFLSRADFSDQPAFSWLTTLSNQVKIAIQNSKILFCNGYGFDELSPHMLTSALQYAVEVGTCVFFDPGPRGHTLFNGTPQQQSAFSHFLTMSDVLLLTSDEVRFTLLLSFTSPNIMLSLSLFSPLFCRFICLVSVQEPLHLSFYVILHSFLSAELLFTFFNTSITAPFFSRGPFILLPYACLASILSLPSSFTPFFFFLCPWRIFNFNY